MLAWITATYQQNMTYSNALQLANLVVCIADWFGLALDWTDSSQQQDRTLAAALAAPQRVPAGLVPSNWDSSLGSLDGRLAQQLGLGFG